MKSCSNSRLSLLIPVMGAAALALRQSLLLFCTDRKGLLPQNHPLQWLLWLVTAAAVALTVLHVRTLEDSRCYDRNFGPSGAAALGASALAAGILVSVLTGFSAGARLALLRTVVGVLAVPALIHVALGRRKGDPPGFLAYALVCGFFTLHTVCRYPGWSSQPQMLHYIFPAAACIFLMLFSYHQTAFCAGMGNRRLQTATGLLAVFCCVAALGGTGDEVLYLTAAVWALTDLCREQPLPDAPEKDAAVR